MESVNLHNFLLSSLMTPNLANALLVVLKANVHSMELSHDKYSLLKVCNYLIFFMSQECKRVLIQTISYFLLTLGPDQPTFEPTPISTIHVETFTILKTVMKGADINSLKG